MHIGPYAAILAELASHLQELERYAREHPHEDPDFMDFVVGLPLESIWLTLADDDLVERVFCDKRFKVALTSLLARIFVVLEFMYLPSPFTDTDNGVCAHRVVRRIETLLREQAWQE